MLRFLILGKPGSGKSFFTSTAKSQGLPAATPYATEPKTPIETKHTDSGTTYYDLNELKAARIIETDPDSMKVICSLFPNEIFRVILITADYKDRVCNQDPENIINFIERCYAEDSVIDQVECDLTTGQLHISNCYIGYVANNDFTENATPYSYFNNIQNYIRCLDRMIKIVNELKDNGVIETPETDSTKCRLYFENNGESDHPYEDIPVELMAENILSDETGMQLVMTSWLELEHNSFNDTHRKDT